MLLPVMSSEADVDDRVLGDFGIHLPHKRTDLHSGPEVERSQSGDHELVGHSKLDCLLVAFPFGHCVVSRGGCHALPDGVTTSA